MDPRTDGKRSSVTGHSNLNGAVVYLDYAASSGGVQAPCDFSELIARGLILGTVPSISSDRFPLTTVRYPDALASVVFCDGAAGRHVRVNQAG